MKRNAVFASLVTLLVAVSAHAVTYDLKVVFDIDRNAATGCTVTTPAGTFAGAEQVLNTRVDVTGGTATTFGVTRQACVGGVVGSALPVDMSSWPAGLTSTGNIFIETHITPAELGLLTSVTPMRVAYFLTNGTLNDSVMATLSGNALFWPHAGRSRAVNPTPAPPRTITLDGNDSDWNGIPPVAGGGNGTADMRILNGYAFGTQTNLYFAVRVQANHNAPTAVPDAYGLETVGGTLNIGAGSGVLANDSDPNSLPLSAVLIAGTQHGVLTLNGNGSFTYANDGSNAPIDTFEYKATNGTLDSNVAQVQIGIGAGSGPPPPPTPKFTSPDHATFYAGQFNSFTVTTTPLNPVVTITGGIGLPAGVTLVNNGNSTATISGTPNIGSGGNYVTSLHAHNVVGDADQFPFTLTVIDTAVAPVITQNPANQTVCNGGTATFTAAASGTPTPSVQWQVSTNGGGTFSNVPGATNTTLSFVANSGQNGNQYRAVFTNVSGTATTTAAVLTVTIPPTVTTHPLPQIVCDGATATFTAAATPAATVQWQVSSGGPFSDLPGATSTTLSFVATAADNAKQYRAVFTNACGTATTNAASLTVSTIVVNPPTLPNATQGVAYGPHVLSATGGVPPYTFTVTAGSLPPGLNLTGAGVLSGTPTTPGIYNFTVTATDANGCTGNRAYSVFVCVTPSVSINASATTFCAGTNVIFTATPVNGGASPTYQWQINGGNVGTNSPTFATAALNNGDNVTVIMTSNAAPCTSVNPVTSNTITVTVNPNPATPTITPTPAQVCSGSTGNSAAGPAGATTYAWSIVNGTITSATNIQNITYTAGASGTVDLTLVVTNAFGCSATNTSNVTINPTPSTPAITALPPQVCANSTGNTADGPAGMATYAWSIANGTITSATNTQSITYTAGASGTVDLTLVVSTGAGCSASNTVNVTINANPTTPTITPTPAAVCANSTGNSADGPAGATTYAWSIANGTITSATNIQTITYTAGASGTVDLTLVVTNAAGCSATNTVNVTINANPATPTITPTPAQVCASSAGNTATGPAGATTYAWSIVNGTITSATNTQAITYTAGASGTVDLTLVVTNAAGCSATNTVNVTINANPTTPTITPTPAAVCANTTGNSADGPAGATTYAWSIVNGSITSATNIQTITYTAGASGTVDLTLVVTNAAGCSATNTINVPINANPATPTITPTPAQVCANTAGNTADGPAGATTYAWSIVNGTITSATNTQSITYTAGASGTVDLTLVVTNAAGCSATNTVNVTINPSPATPTITPNPVQVCANSTGNSADGPAGATTYAWSIVNGTITSATNIQTITYTAGASGTVDLTLVVTNASGCSASNTVNVPINANPTTPTITPNPAQVCANSAGNTADGPAGATTYAWSIVNGTITSATNTQSITYTAGASGTVDLTLVVTNGAGCSATNTVNVTINANPTTPTITPNPAQVCANSTGNSADGPAGATTYAWSIVNGSITSAANIQTITYTAGASGTVDLTLVVTNAAGCSATNTVNVTINPSPATPTITPNPAQVCANSTGNTADGPAGATTYAWSIVNGTITSAANIQTITYTAGASGTVDLTLVVTNASGCPASNTINVPINANPATPTITPNPAAVCANSTGNSADGPAGATTYAWSIVNGTITSATNIQTITYTAGASGTVDLTLVVTNASGCSASNTVNVTINPNPTTPTITPTPAQVCANSTGNSAAGPAGATTYAWSIVNGTITSATNIQTITYTAGASGTVDLTLVVTNGFGCSATNTVNVTINANPATPTITPTPTPVCGGSTGNTATGPAGATTYAWSIVNGTITSATNIQAITYTAGATGTVDLTLVVTNAATCSASNTINVPINPSPATPTITPSSAEVCANTTGNTATGPAGATTYAWSITNGTITSATNIQIITWTANASGTVQLQLTVTNASGCPASNSLNVPINPAVTLLPAPGALPDAIYQSGYSQAFTAGGGTPGFTYSISAAPSGLAFDTNTGVLSGTAPTLPNAVAVFNFNVTATDSKGCTKTQSYTLTVRPKAVNDTYSSPNAVGNTQAMTTAYTPAPGTPKVTYSGTILDNDSSNAAMTVSAGAACNSGVIAFNSNGNWLYTPAVNFTGTATCGYTLTSNSVTNTANVVITISNRVWWVDTNSGVAGDGRSNTPWNNTNAILQQPTAGGANAGDIIYIYNGIANNQKAKITLLANQSLVGEGVALTVNSVLLRAAGTKPVVTNTVGAAPRDVIVLNSGNTVTGLALTSGETTASILTGSPAGLTFTDSTVTTSVSMMGINLTGGSGAVAITNVTFTGTGTGDMIKSNTGTHTWTFTNSPITQTAGRAINATNRTGGGMTFDSNSAVTVSAGTQDGGMTFTSNSGSETFTFNKKVALTMTGAARALVVGGTGTGSLNFADSTSTISTATGSAVDINSTTATTLNITLTSVNQTGGATGIILANTAGTFTVQGNNAGLVSGTGGTISGVTTRAIYILNSSGTVTFKSMNLTINTLADGGVYIDNNTSGNLAVNFTGCAFTGVTGSVSQGKALLQYESGTAATLTGNVQNCFFNGSRTYGFFATGAGTSNLNITLNQCGFGTNVNSGAPVNQPGTSITNPPAIGMAMTYSSSADVAFTVTNNTFWGADGILGGPYAVTFSGAAGTSSMSMTGSFSGNKIGKTGTVGSGCSNGCAALGLLVGQNGVYNVTLNNNDIRQVNSLGVNVFLPNASATGTAIAHITNNTITEPDTTGAPAFQRALVVTTGNSGGTSLNACTQITGNNISGAWQASNLIRVTTLNTTGTLTIPGLTPLSGATGAQVDTYLESVNTVGAGNANTTVGGAINGSASPCP